MDECIDVYLDLSKEVFKVDQVLAGRIPVGDNRCRFDYNILEKRYQKPGPEETRQCELRNECHPENNESLSNICSCQNCRKP